MKLAWVKTNLLDMRQKPDHHSERVNQALFGDIVSIIGESKGFYEVKKQDSYKGWVAAGMVQEAPEDCIREYEGRINRIVGISSAGIYDCGRNKKVEPYFCYYGTRVAMIRKRNNLATLALPDGSTIQMPSSVLRAIRPGNTKGSELVVEARKFLGVPYLWGGLSPAGYDCSGLVQMVCARFGISIPRDTKDQLKFGVKIARDNTKAGDLLFFDRHVGFAFGRNKVIHSSRRGGGVRINSLSPDVADYREDLDKTFQEARRIV